MEHSSLASPERARLDCRESVDDIRSNRKILWGKAIRGLRRMLTPKEFSRVPLPLWTRSSNPQDLSTYHSNAMGYVNTDRSPDVSIYGSTHLQLVRDSSLLDGLLIE